MADAGSLVAVSLNGSANGSQQLASGLSAYSITIDGSSLADGTVNVSATATDAAGNVNNPAEATAVKDTVEPSVSETTPINPLANDSTPDVVINVETGAAWAIKNGDTAIKTGTGTGANETVTLNELADGTYNLILTATDGVGNAKTISLSQFEIDTKLPTVNLLSPLAGQTITGGSISYISWTAGDKNFGDTPIKLQYSIDNGINWVNILENTIHNPVGEHGISEYAWTVPNITSPSYRVKITATDLAGNYATSDIGPFTVSRNTNPAPICVDSANGQKTCNIALKKGWNLISSPVVINGDIANVLSGISDNLNVAQHYNNGAWMYYMPVQGGSLTKIEDGKGYWIFMNEADTLTLTGLANPAVDDSGSLLPGSYNINSKDWNLIGFRSIRNMNAKEYVDHYITDAFGNDYIMWKFENGTSLEPLYLSQDMKSGYGYWLYTR